MNSPSWHADGAGAQRSPHHVRLLPEHLALLAPEDTIPAARFCKRPSEKNFDMAHLMAGPTPEQQQTKLQLPLKMAVASPRQSEGLQPALHELVRHRQYHVEPAHCRAIASFLVETMRQLAGMPGGRIQRGLASGPECNQRADAPSRSTRGE